MKQERCINGMEVIITNAPEGSRAVGYRGVLRIYSGTHMTIELPPEEIARYKANKGNWFVPNSEISWAITYFQIEPVRQGFRDWARKHK